MGKTLLVLAASTYQVPAIEAAKRLGYRVITTDNCPSNPGHLLADACFAVDTTDRNGVLALARAASIAGVIAPGTDVAVMTAAHLSEHLKIPGPPAEAAQILTSKFFFREFLIQSGLPSPKAFLLEAGQKAAEGLFNGSKWLVKPNRSSGSKGVCIVKSGEELTSAIGESRSFSMDGTVVLEQFIEGTQHTCEGVLAQGKLRLNLLTDRDTASEPHTATTGHRVPSRLPQDMQTKALAMIEDVLTRLRVTSGPFDCDFVAAGGQIYLIEIAPRLGGNSLSKLFKQALDFDLVGYAISHACGDAFPLSACTPLKPGAIIILGVESSGRLAWNRDEEKVVRQEPWLESLIFDLPQGAAVNAFINGRHRVGEALIMGRDRDEVDARRAELLHRLNLRAV